MIRYKYGRQVPADPCVDVHFVAFYGRWRGAGRFVVGPTGASNLVYCMVGTLYRRSFACWLFWMEFIGGDAV